MMGLNPCHPGETLRDDVQASGLTVTERSRPAWVARARRCRPPRPGNRPPGRSTIVPGLDEDVVMLNR